MAIPRAPPSSAPVSEMPEAAPACSGGADPTISSVVSPNTGRHAQGDDHRPGDQGSQPAVDADLGQQAQPGRGQGQAAADHPDRPHVVQDPGRNWLPRMNPTAEGSDHSPASSGDRPTTSWRYWATNRK